MPIGDPHGGDFNYTEEGLPKCIFLVEIPSSDIERSLTFYVDMLGMDIIYRREKDAAVRRGSATVVIRLSGDVGKDTGICFGVDDPYDLHRRLIDEGVRFVKDPQREPLGVRTSFMDPDGNILHAMETGAQLRL